MSTVFFTGQNQQTGATELYSVTGSSLGNLRDFLSPSSDIVTNIWQKRYVFLNNKYYDGMSSNVEKTDANTIVNRTVSMSEAKLRNKKTDDVKYRFTANGLKQFKKDEGISLLLKIDEYADEFVLLPVAEEIQLKPTARKILELIDKSRQIFTEDVLVRSAEGGNIIAWRVGSFNGHTVLVLENTPDAQKFVLANEDAIVGSVHRVPAEFDENAVAVNAKFFVGNDPKDCLQRGDENIREPLVAGATAQVVRQWKNYFELSLSDYSHAFVELTMGSDDGCHVEYGVYGDDHRFQYIELTKVTPIEGEPSSIGSRWRVSSMNFTGITPEINVFTPNVQETITDLDAFKFVQDLGMVSLANTTLKVVRDVNLRPSFSLEVGQGRSYGKLVVGTSGIVVDSVVYDYKGRAWFHVRNEEGLPLTNKPTILANSVIKQGWLNGKCTVDGAEQSFRFEELPVEPKEGYNIREKACDYVVVTQNLGLIEEDLANKKAWTMSSVDAVGVDGTVTNLPAGKEVRLVQKTREHLKFKVGETLYTVPEVPEPALGTSIRIDATPEHASAFVPKENEIKIGDTYQCISKADTLQSFCAFVVDDLSEKTIDAVASSVMSGDEIFTVLGEHTHGSVRYLQLMSGDDEEGITFWADASSVVIPTSYDLAEGNKAKSFAPEGVIFLESPLSNREAAVERREAGSNIDDLMDSAKGVNVKSAWGISVTAEDKTVFTNSKLCALEQYPTRDGATVHVLGTTKLVRPVKFYRDADSIKAFVYDEIGPKSIDGVDGDFRVSNNAVKDISNSTLYFAQSVKEVEGGGQQCDIIWGDMEPVNDEDLNSLALMHDSASDEYFLMGVSDVTDVFERDADSDFVPERRFVTHGSFEAFTNFNKEKIAITDVQLWNGCRVLKGISKSGDATTNLYVYKTENDELRMLTRKWADVMSDDSRGTLVVTRSFASINSSDEFVTVSEPDGIVRKVSSDTTVPKLYVNAHNANGNYIAIDCFPAHGDNVAQVTAGTKPNIVKKVSAKDADGNVVVYLVSDDGLAYPESVLEEVQDNSFNDQYADNPLKLWITRDPEGTDSNNPIASSFDEIVLPCYASPNSVDPEAEAFTFDAHGAVVDLLGENGVGYTEDGSWIHISHMHKTGYVHNILLNDHSLYARTVEKVNTKAVFVGNSNTDQRQSIAEFGTSAKNQCESDAMGGNNLVLRQGDIVTFSWKYNGSKTAMLFEKEESIETPTGTVTHKIIHSVNTTRVAESFAEIDPAKDMFYINQGIPASLSYGDVETLSSVPSSTVPMPNENNNLFIAPGIPTDAYMSYRISLKNGMVADNGNVDVSGYSFKFSQIPVIATNKVTVGNNIYYAFSADILYGADSVNVGTVTVWALSSQLSRVVELTEEDVDLHMFPKKVVQSDVVYLLDAPNNSANPTELAGVPELRAEKACKDNGVIKYYKLAGDQAGKYIDANHVVIIDNIPDTANVRLFHNYTGKDTLSEDFKVHPMYSDAVYSIHVAHGEFLHPLRKVSYANGQQTIVAYEVGIANIDSNSQTKAWILAEDVIAVPSWVETPATNDERISIDANTDALLWPDEDAPVMHTFANTEEKELHIVVLNNDDSTKYYGVSMKRGELNKADPHISVDDPTTVNIESLESVVLYIPVDHAHQVQPSAVKLDLADFNMFVGDVDGNDVSEKRDKGWGENSIGSAFMSKWTKPNGSGEPLTQSEGVALISYLAAHQWVAHVDGVYSKNNSTIAYRVAYRGAEDNGFNPLACLTLDDTTTESWVSEQKVTPLTNQDAVVVESDNETEGEILTVLWKFTAKDGSERHNCGIAVPADSPESPVCEIVQIITL